MARILRVLHRTEYRYDRPVVFGPHRLMLRPRDGHDLWVDDAFLSIEPKASVRWFFDTFGNSVAEATFSAGADSLTVVSELLIRRYPSHRPIAGATQEATPYPFAYTEEDAIDLGPFLVLQNPAEAEQLTRWMDGKCKVRSDKASTVLRQLSDTIHRLIAYSARDALGTQSAMETITAGRGTCRDFALLFIEAARLLGFAARFVTGYLHDETRPDQPEADRAVGGGATHAWADVFIPGEGWIQFDPTNRIIEGAQLIRVATTRTPRQASPISGTFTGAGASFLGLDVSVGVSEVETVA